MNSVPHILLVEDSADDVFIFKRALQDARIKNPVVVVSNGQDAIDYLSRKSAYSDTETRSLPFVIFLDLKLPYQDGFEVLEWIRNQPVLQTIPVVVLSGSGEIRDHQRAYALGARSYLIKPPDSQHILQFIDSMRSYWGSADYPWPVVIESGYD